jgi:hypothetical protein
MGWIESSGSRKNHYTWAEKCAESAEADVPLLAYLAKTRDSE